jgi:hypothetical protein
LLQRKAGNNMSKVIEWIKMYVRGGFMRKPNSREIIDFLNEKWNGTQCPMCHENEWNIEGIFELREFKDGNLIVVNDCKIIPVIPVTCKNCGNTILINPLTTGLMRK